MGSEKLVRCADCAHNKETRHGNRSCEKLLIMNPPAGFFCGYGKERDGE